MKTKQTNSYFNDDKKNLFEFKKQTNHNYSLVKRTNVEGQTVKGANHTSPHINKDWKLEDKVQEVSDYEIRNIGTIHPAVAEKILEVKDIKEFLRKCEKQKICSIHHRYDCGCEDRYMMVSLSNIKQLAGKSLVEKSK